MRVAIIPALNEASTISSVVECISSCVDHVVVVNDCSTDTTSAVALAHGAIVLNNSSNIGYDASIYTGLLYSYNLGATSIITLDADGQHNCADFSKLFYHLETNINSLVVGSRDTHPRISEILISFASARLFGLTDITSGLKLYSRSVLKNCLSLSDYDSVGTYLLFNALSSGYHVTEIPISISARHGGNSRIGSSIQVDLKLIYAFLKGCINVFLSKLKRLSFLSL